MIEPSLFQTNLIIWFIYKLRDLIIGDDYWNAVIFLS